MDWRLESSIYEEENSHLHHSVSAPSSYVQHDAYLNKHNIMDSLSMSEHQAMREYGMNNGHVNSQLRENALSHSEHNNYNSREYNRGDMGLNGFDDNSLHFQYGNSDRGGALGFSNNGRNGGLGLGDSSHQNTRHARRLYFGGIPPNYADEELLKMFLNNIISKGLNEENDFSYVVSVYINHKKCFAFVELKSIELTTACLELDGIVYRNSVLKVQRANEYKPEAVGPFSSRSSLKLSLPAEVFSGAVSISATTVQDTAEPRLTSLIVQGTMASIERGAIVLLGFPFDEGSRRSPLGRPGGANGPKIIRRFIGRLGSFVNPEFGFDIGNVLLVDIGDIPVGLTLDEAHARLALIVAEIVHRGGIPVVIGGSNDMSYFNAAGLMTIAGGAVGIVNVSSQLNVKPANSDNKIHSGSTYRLLLEDTRFCPPRNGLASMPSCEGKFLSFGCQGAVCSLEQSRYVSDRNGRVMWLSKDIRVNKATFADSPAQQAAAPGLVNTNAGRAFRRALLDLSESPSQETAAASAARARRHLMVAFSMDAIASAACPGVINASSLGFSAEETLEMCFLAGANPNVVLLDISEYNPDIEEPRTGRLIADMFYYYVMGVASRTPPNPNASNGMPRNAALLTRPGFVGGSRSSLSEGQGGQYPPLGHSSSLTSFPDSFDQLSNHGGGNSNAMSQNSSHGLSASNHGVSNATSPKLLSHSLSVGYTGSGSNNNSLSSHMMSSTPRSASVGLLPSSHSFSSSNDLDLSGHNARGRTGSYLQDEATRLPSSVGSLNAHMLDGNNLPGTNIGYW